MQDYHEYAKNRFISLDMVSRYEHDEETKRLVLHLLTDNQEYHVGEPYQETILYRLERRQHHERVVRDT